MKLLDYIVFGLTLVISMLIGIYHSYKAKNQNTLENYLMGNRMLAFFPVMLSILMSEISGTIVLGFASEIYMYGTQMLVNFIVSDLGIILSAYLYIPLMRALNVTSVFEYHQLRFNSIILHKLCVIMFMLSMIIQMSIAIFGPSIALEAVSGFPVWASILCIGALAIIYTTIGGLKAVVWTDVFQGFVFVAGLLIILIFGCIEVGGLNEVWNISQKGNRIILFNINIDPTERTTFWSGIAFFVLSLGDCMYSQAVVQRYCAVPNIRTAYCVVMLQLPIKFIVLSLISLCGLVVYAYYSMVECDPFRGRQVSNPNQLLPYFLSDVVPYQGLTGLFIAVMFSGALSTVSSLLNGLAAISWKDFLEECFPKSSEYKKTIIIKINSLIYGIISLGLSYAASYYQGNIVQFTTALIGGFIGPLIGVVLAGTLIPWVTGKGMIFGTLAGLGLASWINIGQLIYFPHRHFLDTTVDNCTFTGNQTAIPILPDRKDVLWIYQISYTYIPLLSTLTTIIIGFIASLIFGKQDLQLLNPKTVINYSAKFGCCFPSRSCRKRCTCGISFDDYSDQVKLKDNNLHKEFNNEEDFKEKEQSGETSKSNASDSQEIQTYL